MTEERPRMERDLEKKRVRNVALMDGFTEKERSALVQVCLKIFLLEGKTSRMLEIQQSALL